jgi:hypothetical protein
MGSGTYRAATRTKIDSGTTYAYDIDDNLFLEGGGLMKNRVLAAIGGFGFAFGAFAGVGTMEGGHVWLGLAIIAMALACGCLVVLVARSEALSVKSEIEERRAGSLSSEVAA